MRATPLGLGVTFFCVAFCALLAWIARRLPWWTVVPLVVFAVLVAWRDSPWLVSLDVFALVVAVAIGALRTAPGRVAVAGVVDYAIGLGAAAVGATIGTTFVLDEVQWDEFQVEGRSEQLAAVGRGVLIAVPLLALFGALFVTADAVFGNLLGGLAPSSRTLTHIGVITLWFWVGTGLLRQLSTKRADPVVVERTGELGVTEIVVALASLNALFLAFVLVQIEAFAGGRGFVESHAHVTYSSYARQGFFELVAVAALVVPLLLLADWWVARPARIVRALQASLIALLFLVMASALWRMRLYEQRYGLTELRVYTTGFMLWLGVVLAWFLATVLRGRRELFGVGALVSGFAAILLVHALNPDAVIARVDARRAHPDLGYLEGLSDDALPTLVHELPHLRPRDRRDLALLLLDHRHPHAWRSWNLSRARAASLRDDLQRLRSTT